jgi:hypothetical protein
MVSVSFSVLPATGVNPGIADKAVAKQMLLSDEYKDRRI